MTILQALLAFIAAASILTVTPGVDTLLVLRSATSGGPRPAVFAALGIALGCLAWGAAVSIGLGALIAASPFAFTLLKWTGAAYLLWLGVKLLLRPRARLDAAEPGPAQAEAWLSLRQGFLTNLLNPKVGIFYITFLPQFVPAGVSVAAFSFLLASLHVVLGLLWFALLIAATVPLGRLLRRPRVIKTMDRVTGGMFVAFGAKLALSR
jgi:threonine/homoserine/homoserine lactone efflux protein